MQSKTQNTDPVVRQSSSSNQNSTRKRYDVLSYEEYKNRGRQIKALTDAIPTKDKIVMPRGQLPTNKDIECTSLSEGYSCQEEPIYFTYDVKKIERLPFPAFNIPSGTGFVELRWEAKMRANSQPTDHDPRKDLPQYVNVAAYNAKEGSIVMSFLSANYDGWPDDAPQKNYCSEITWQSWKKIAGSDCGNLKLVFQEDIQSEGTRKVIEETYEKHKIGVMENTTFCRNGKGPEQEAFLALLGTDNARPVEYMLKDHFVAVGRKKIQRIRVFPYHYPGTQRSWHMVFEIGLHT